MDNGIKTTAAIQAAWSIDQWLDYLSEIHPKNIEMGLERVGKVFARLQLDFSTKTVVTVGGTNGKGTTCAMVEQALLLNNMHVAVFSSPHLIDYRERVRVQGQMLSHEQHCAAFAIVEKARADILLTYFEFGTLQALVLMAQSQSDYVILEVGLGGRLDAVNIINANIAVITSIDLDHQEWLGHTREAIAVEKAGIFRANIPVVIGEPEPPLSLKHATDSLSVISYWQGQDFCYDQLNGLFNWQNDCVKLSQLPLPLIPAQNAATALQILHLLGVSLTDEFVRQLFVVTQLPGRRQIIQQHPRVMVDVGHNPHATRLLARELSEISCRRIIAVVGMLADKDIEQSLTPLLDVVDDWYCASLTVPRGASADKLVSVLKHREMVLDFESVSLAYQAALTNAQEDDFILVFGSFFTVAEVLTMNKVA